MEESLQAWAQKIPQLSSQMANQDLIEVLHLIHRVYMQEYVLCLSAFHQNIITDIFMMLFFMYYELWRFRSQGNLLLHCAEKKRKNKWKVENPTKPSPQWNQGSFLNGNPTIVKTKQLVKMPKFSSLLPYELQVDISTMLEEAVQYVKFLQLQIKVTTLRILFILHPNFCSVQNIFHFIFLGNIQSRYWFMFSHILFSIWQLLSSDDLWMYAPIAYNGMNIGLNLNITPTKQP